MPTPPKALDNMSKNLTDEERQLRQQAEEGVIPDRGRESRMEKPAIMTKNAAAGRYWKKVLDRMDGLVILDDLDSDALGVYCVMMARYETQCRLLASASRALKDAESDPEAVADAVSKLDTVSGKMQSLERNILQYAEKLGLTPSGRVRLAQKRAQAAAATAQAADFVNAMDEGVDSPISQGGTNVSGGQRQRLSIARALARKAPIYIFDDSFSALDFKTDAALRKALAAETRDAAVLIIAQRVSSIRHAHQIVVLHEGKMAGIGTHEELMETCRVYQEIYESQTKEAEA